MAWPAQIERWRQFATWEGRDVPPDLILAIIAAESAGKPGLRGPAPLVGAAIPTDAGGAILVHTALGLMQVAPLTVQAYNDAHAPPVTLDDLTGTDERAARQQIRIGTWAYAAMVNRLHRYDPRTFSATSPGAANADQLKIALAMYAGGPRPILDALNRLAAAGRPRTWTNLRRTSDHAAVAYAARRWDAYQAAGTDGATDRKGKTSWFDLGALTPAIIAWILIRLFKKPQQETTLLND